LNIININNLPEVQLNKANWLCAGDTRKLNAGNGFANYLWQDGSNASAISVNNTGTYWVLVTDKNGCMGSDTINITQILPIPHGFLATDSTICNGFPSKIQAKGSYNSYSWSTGETGNSIITRKSGTLSLTVTDSYGCTATESIIINTKQCLFGIFFPNAFSPNQDGANDNYKPIVFGNLITYKLRIYNRWGQLIFETTDFSKGWDGSLGGKMQNAGGYAWICHYQFENEPEKKESGTILLIR
jgi:gliding motility-associated-like protein